MGRKSIASIRMDRSCCRLDEKHIKSWVPEGTVVLGMQNLDHIIPCKNHTVGAAGSENYYRNHYCCYSDNCFGDEEPSFGIDSTNNCSIPNHHHGLDDGVFLDSFLGHSFGKIDSIGSKEAIHRNPNFADHIVIEAITRRKDQAFIADLQACHLHFIMVFIGNRKAYRDSYLVLLEA